MFNNANVIFRTKFVDGVSTVTRTIGTGSSTRQTLAASSDNMEEDEPNNSTNTKRRRGARGGKENSQLLA